jgi:hypothetical protein
MARRLVRSDVMSDGVGERETVLYNGVCQRGVGWCRISTPGPKVEMCSAARGLRRGDLSCLCLLGFEFGLVGCMCGITTRLQVDTISPKHISNPSARKEKHTRLTIHDVPAVGGTHRNSSRRTNNPRRSSRPDADTSSSPRWPPWRASPW